MLPRISAVVMFTALLIGSGFAGDETNCSYFCGYSYPYVEEMHTGPLIESTDSTVFVKHPYGYIDTVKYVGYYYRFWISNLTEYGWCIVDKISVIRTHDEYDERVLDTCYSVDLPLLCCNQKTEGTEIRFIEWSSSTSIKVELFRRDCYEFLLTPDPDSVTAKICE